MNYFGFASSCCFSPFPFEVHFLVAVLVYVRFVRGDRWLAGVKTALVADERRGQRASVSFDTEIRKISTVTLE